MKLHSLSERGEPTGADTSDSDEIPDSKLRGIQHFRRTRISTIILEDNSRVNHQEKETKKEKYIYVTFVYFSLTKLKYNTVILIEFTGRDKRSHILFLSTPMSILKQL